eukprot:CAMPEP_0195593676 /NCGR_PEP_ID=MMETSP0815-20121206/1012_1 /TAXON_ID=97485 /ORGANISM="Prymnesium parvum, Strain Texoma1" /LENGTH=352 /DNA_ID=CAMNT_0040732833 /DNA_START=28 /DNA_END=1085 /DNA_ORIENTATION=-
MSHRRDCRLSVPSMRFRMEEDEPSQLAVAPRRASGAAPPRPTHSRPPSVLAPKVLSTSPTAAPSRQPSAVQPLALAPTAPVDQPTVVQHFRQQFVVSSCPAAVACPVLPFEDLWSVLGLQSATSDRSTTSRWKHGRSRTLLGPWAPSPAPAEAYGASAIPAMPKEWGRPVPAKLKYSSVDSVSAEAIALAASERQTTPAPAPPLPRRSRRRPPKPGGGRSPRLCSEVSDRHAAVAFEAARAEYAAGVARAALLRRAGRVLDAHEFLSSPTISPLPPTISSRSLSPRVPTPGPATHGVSAVAAQQLVTLTPAAHSTPTSSTPTASTATNRAFAVDDWLSLVESYVCLAGSLLC